MKSENNYITSVTEKPRQLPIKPPRSNKKKPCTVQSLDIKNQPSCYSLFDTMSPPLNWLDKKPMLNRKHSVSVDGSDGLKYENNYAGFWRRASLPNKQSFLNSSSCAVRNLHIYSTNNMKKICDHSICQQCITISSCPLCPNTPLMELISPPSSINSSSATSLYNHIPTSFNNSSNLNGFIYPHHQEEKFYIGDLLSPSTAFGSFSNCDTKPEFYCVKIANIPWDVSQKDIKLFFKDFELPSGSMHAQSIHIMMDRMTGKTLSDCYIEFLSESEAIRAAEYGNQRILKNRLVSVSVCSHDEFLGITFPSWESGFTGSQSNDPVENSTNWFITREEINSLLAICKNYKLHFSRKCAERPFENIVSIVTKLPWERRDLITKKQRDDIFDMLKLSIDALKIHLSKEVVHIDNSLLQRVIRCGIMCETFTEQQKNTLLEIGGFQSDLELFMSSAKYSDQHISNTLYQEITHLDTSYIYVKSTPLNLSSGTLSLLDILNTSQPGKESDEDSYYFCEKEDVEDDEDSFYKL